MFLFKKIVTPFLMPYTVGLGAIFIGILLLWLSGRQKYGKLIVTAGFGFLLLCSYPVASTLLLYPLENKYPALISGTELNPHRPEWIIVLGGGQKPDINHPVSSHLPASALTRMVEGIRLAKIYPDTKLILSGGRLFGAKASQAETSANLARALGIEPKRIVLANYAKDTKDEARQIKKITGKERAILVTSAYHMPRAVALFRKQGLQVTPSPTDYFITQTNGTRPGDFFPGTEHILRIQVSLHEYLGMIWAKLQGQI